MPDFLALVSWRVSFPRPRGPDQPTARMSRPSERGSVAAELAVALPAVMLVILLGAGALSGAARQVALQDAAADAARVLGRGESVGEAKRVVAATGDGIRLSVVQRGDLVCATTRSDVRVGGVRMPLEASSCALTGGL